MTLLISLGIMIVAVAVARPLSSRLGRNAGYPMAFLFLTALSLVLTGAPEVLEGGTLTGEWMWIQSLDIALRLHLDGLSLVFAILALGVGALIMSYCARYLSEEYDHGRLYMLLSLFATAMLGMVLSADIITLFVFFEITTLCSFFLIGAQGLHQARPATRAFVVTFSGGLALLTAVLLLWHVTGTTNLTEILDDAGTVTSSPYAPWIGGLIIYAAMTKSAQFPFHFWLPDAMVALTPVSAYLHAATLVKAGIYVLMRFSEPFTDFWWWTTVLVAVGLTTTIIGAVFALQQHDLKSLLAYSTVSQLGWIVALIGVGTNEALGVAGLHAFSHALFKATLFMLVGVIDKEAGSRDIRELSGLYRVMPCTAVLTALAAMSMAGLPPFLGFVSKEEGYYAFLELPGHWGWIVGLLAVASAGVTFAYSFRLLWGAFAGPTQQRGLYDAHWTFLAPAAVTAGAGLLLGLFVSSLNPLFDRSVQATVLDADAYAGLSLLPDSIASPALWMSVATMVFGLILFLASEPVDRSLQRLVMPVTGVKVYDAAYAGLLRFCDLVARPARSGALAPHVLWPLGAVAALAAAVPFLDDLDAVGPPSSRPQDWFVVGLTTLAVLGLCLTRSRIGAVAMMGVIGFLVAGWFLLIGGVDLALTQMLVEILTVAVAVLILRRLPEKFSPVGVLRRSSAAVVAAVIGLAAGAAVLVLTGRPESTAAAQWYIDETEEAAGGTNLVNSILVDFRGLDTFGEMTVLAVAAIGLLALLRGEAPADQKARTMDLPGDETVLNTARIILVPLISAVALWLLWRGHYEPGGGFVSALVAALAVVIARLPRSAESRPSRLRPAALLAAGLIVAIAAGALGLLQGSFLSPITGSIEIGAFYQAMTTSLIFDLGVFFAVLGLVVAALDRFTRGAVSGASAEDPDAAPPPGAREPRTSQTQDPEIQTTAVEGGHR